MVGQQRWWDEWMGYDGSGDRTVSATAISLATAHLAPAPTRITSLTAGRPVFAFGFRCAQFSAHNRWQHRARAR